MHLELKSRPPTENWYEISTELPESCGSETSAERMIFALVDGQDRARILMRRSQSDTPMAPSPKSAKTTRIAKGMADLVVVTPNECKGLPRPEAASECHD